MRTIAQSSNVCRSLRWFSVSSSDQKHSFAVSYLINSLGFSLEAALSASKHLKFDSPEKPDKAIEVFKGYGFAHSQISSLVKRCPKIFSCDAEKIILPKLEFLVSKGLSGPELAQRLSVYPTLLTRSLANQIMPAYEFFRNFFRSDDMTNRAVRRSPEILAFDTEKYVGPNIYTLRQHGVPDSKITTLLCSFPKIISTSSVQFREIVKEVVEMGFDSSKTEFVLAVYGTYLKNGISKWESKVNAYKKWGWSDEDVSRAFRKNPCCMLVSEKKITAVMDFFITKMGLQPCDLAHVPTLFVYSLEKRIIPRVSFYQVLLSRGRLKKEISLLSLVVISEKDFLQKFVTPFADEAPELLKLYKEKLSLSSRPERGQV